MSKQPRRRATVTNITPYRRLTHVEREIRGLRARKQRLIRNKPAKLSQEQHHALRVALNAFDDAIAAYEKLQRHALRDLTHTSRKENTR